MLWRKNPTSMEPHFVHWVHMLFSGISECWCLTTRCHNEDDQCLPPPFTRLGTGTVIVQTVAEFSRDLTSTPYFIPTRQESGSLYTLVGCLFQRGGHAAKLASDGP